VIFLLSNLIYRVSQKVAPYDFQRYFRYRAESFCIEFCCTFIGKLYPRTCTDFRLFTLTFNEMALILSRAPIIFTVSSLDCSAGINAQSISLTEMTLLASGVDSNHSTADFLTLYDQGNRR